MQEEQHMNLQDLDEYNRREDAWTEDEMRQQEVIRLQEETRVQNEIAMQDHYRVNEEDKIQAKAQNVTVRYSAFSAYVPTLNDTTKREPVLREPKLEISIAEEPVVVTSNLDIFAAVARRQSKLWWIKR